MSEDDCDLSYTDAPCPRCYNAGYVIVCIDDLCRNSEHCMHGDGEIICPECKGESGEYP